MLATPFLLASLALALLSVSLWRDGATYIDEISSTLSGIRRLVAGDSEHYLAIADSLREGDFRMEHVEPTGGSDRAHRQPGYPALLAVAGKLGIERAPSLAKVNLAILVLSLWIAFVAGRLATGSTMAGLLAAAVIYDVHFLFDIATGRLLTEPLFVAVALAAVGSCLGYLRRGSPALLSATAVFAAMAYLVRVNGLFLAFALGFVAMAADAGRTRRDEPDVATPDLVLHYPWGRHAAALLLLVVVSIPSWLPRLVYAGNPVYHGYLSNYLWVDDYQRAHQPGPPRYSLSTYVSEHDAGDAVSRMAWGLNHVFHDTPRDKFGIVVSVALFVAVVVVFALRDRAGILLVVAGVMQALPLAWTAIADPARRLPATALLPFVAFVVAAAAAAALRRAHRSKPR